MRFDAPCRRLTVPIDSVLRTLQGATFVKTLMEGTQMFPRNFSSFDSRKILVTAMLLLVCGLGMHASWAAGTAEGVIESRPAPVFRRVCVAGDNIGELCKQNAECPGSECTDKNVFNITVAVLYDAPAADIQTIKDLITAMSEVLLDVTDGQAEIGQATIHNNAISDDSADLVIHPSSNDVWWVASTGDFRNGGIIQVGIDHITDPTGANSDSLTHEFVHLVFDARDEYEVRQPNCGAVIKNCAGGANAGDVCNADADCTGSSCENIGNCPHPSSGEPPGLMDGGRPHSPELCWGQADPSDLTDLSGGNHDPFNETEQSSCRDNRSVWDQVVWSWPSTFVKPVGAPDSGTNGAIAIAPNFVETDNTVRVVLVLDESYSMHNESPSRMQRLKVAAHDFIATAEDGTEVGIVSYASDVSTASGRKIVPIDALGNDRSEWTDAVASLTPSTRTNIGAALQKAQELITDAGGVTANTYIVLMTDGRNNEPTPQASADADLQTALDELLLAGIPVYVTCTGGDLGVQAQCAEIANETNGFNSDSDDVSQLPVKFVNFHEKITGHQMIDTVSSDFANIGSQLKRISYAFGNRSVVAFAKPFFVDQGTESISFRLQWDSAGRKDLLSVTSPGGTSYAAKPIPYGQYVRIDAPEPGEWAAFVVPAGHGNSRFELSAFTHNRVNKLNASFDKAKYAPGEAIEIHAFPRSVGGPITSEGAVIAVEVTRPDGSVEAFELRDAGRDADGQGDDMAGDGVFTGIYENTGLKGAYAFTLRANIEDWVLGNDIDSPGPIDYQGSHKFERSFEMSTAVADPSDDVTVFEDDSQDSPPVDQQPTVWLLVAILVLLVAIVFLIWYCCCRRGKLG